MAPQLILAGCATESAAARTPRRLEKSFTGVHTGRRQSGPACHGLCLRLGGHVICTGAQRQGDRDVWHSGPFAGMGAAAYRLLGGVALDPMLSPATALTPAEFWRRWNRPAQQFLETYAFRPAGGLHHPVARRGLRSSSRAPRLARPHIPRPNLRSTAVPVRPPKPSTTSSPSGSFTSQVLVFSWRKEKRYSMVIEIDSTIVRCRIIVRGRIGRGSTFSWRRFCDGGSGPFSLGRLHHVREHVGSNSSSGWSWAFGVLGFVGGLDADSGYPGPAVLRGPARRSRRLV